MEKLKQILESTLINNLETTIIYSSLEYDSLQTTSNIIAQEIKDIAIEFSSFIGLHFDGNNDFMEEQFNQFINDKYQES